MVAVSTKRQSDPYGGPYEPASCHCCDIDDFCKWFEPLYLRCLLQSGQGHRARQGHLALREIMTMLVDVHRSH
jgi:hypothetical protein